MTPSVIAMPTVQSVSHHMPPITAAAIKMAHQSPWRRRCALCRAVFGVPVHTEMCATQPKGQLLRDGRQREGRQHGRKRCDRRQDDQVERLVTGRLVMLRPGRAEPGWSGPVQGRE